MPFSLLLFLLQWPNGELDGEVVIETWNKEYDSVYAKLYGSLTFPHA